MEKMEEIRMLVNLHKISSLVNKTQSQRSSPSFPGRRSILKDKRRSGHKVGIFCSETMAMDLQWLEDVLCLHKLKKIECSRFKDKTEIKQEASKYTFCIYVCHEHNWRNILSSLWSEAMRMVLERMPLIVVIADMEDSSDKHKDQILHSLKNTGLEHQHLFLFSRQEIFTHMQNHRTIDQEQPTFRGLAAGKLERRSDSFLSSFRKMGSRPPLHYEDLSDHNRSTQLAVTCPSNTQEKHNSGDSFDLPKSMYPSIASPQHAQEKPHNSDLKTNDLQKQENAKRKQRNISKEDKTHKRHIVGIFSRSSSKDYSWLTKLLTKHFKDSIQDVRTCYITNDGFQLFMDEMSQCTIGILYHTKNRGRVNITDVTSSLYDEELENLERMLGKDNVIVVIDDLQDTSDKEKSRILKTQPSIIKWARDLLLISEREKTEETTIVAKLESVKLFCHPSETVSKKSESQHRPEPKPLKDIPASRRHDIVIFSILEDSKVCWLRKLLSELFGHRQVTCQQFSLHEGLHERALQCKFVIIYHSMRSLCQPNTSEGGFLYDRVLRQMSANLERNNVMLIIDDLRDHREREKMRRFCNELHLGKLASELLLLLHTEKDDAIHVLKKLKTIQKLYNSSECSLQERSMLSRPKTIDAHSQKNPTSPRSAIGIFSISDEEHSSWLRRLLSSDIFGQTEVTFHKLASYDNTGPEEVKLPCRVAILYHTMRSGPPVSRQGDFLYFKVTEELRYKLGKANVVVLIDDLPDNIDGKWVRWSQYKIQSWSDDLLYIYQAEKYNEELLAEKLKNLKPFRQPPEFRPKADRDHLTSGTSNTKSAPAHPVIGVFSRSERSKFSWLYRLLSSAEFGNNHVIFHQISPDNSKDFQSDVSRCEFGILYHCMEKGYRPITDHENSLYDEELQYLSSKIGKKRTIVVLDEAGISNEEAKSWTLESQPSLGMLARDVLLFSTSEKAHEAQKTNRSVHVYKKSSSVYEKLSTLKTILNEK